MNSTSTSTPTEATPIATYAIVEAGGQQIKVHQGDRISLNSLEAEVGSEVILDKVLLVRTAESVDGSKLGLPYLDGVSVVATVLEHTRGPKVISFKKRRRQRYKRTIGHRQDLTILKITSIAGI